MVGALGLYADETYWLWIADLLMAQQRAIPQSKEQLLKSYTKRMKDDIRSMVDNYTEIFKLNRVFIFPLVAQCLNVNASFPPRLVCTPPYSDHRSCDTWYSSHANVVICTLTLQIVFQLDEESQVSRPTQAEEDHYEMQVRASNIVSLSICSHQLAKI